MPLTRKQRSLLTIAIVLLLLTVSWLLFKPTDYFEMQVTVLDETTHQPPHLNGSLTLDIGAEKRRATLDTQLGVAHFSGLPAALHDTVATISLDMNGYNLPKSAAQLRLPKGNVTLSVQVIKFKLSGQVQDTQQQPIAGAQIDLVQYHTQTDENGWFTLEVPVTLLNKTERLRVTALGFKPYQLVAIQDERPQVLLLQHEQ